MSARWSFGAALLSSTAAKSSSRAAAQRCARAASSSSCRLAINTSPAAARNPAAPQLTLHAAPSQRRWHSTPPKDRHHSPFRKGDRDALSTLSAVGHLLAAGTGTFASTLVALYLATVVESSAHDVLYEYFPHWYAEIREEDLPACLRQREIARRVTGISEAHRAQGVEGTEGLMGMDGWMDMAAIGGGGGRRILEAEEAELLAEAEFERRQEAKGINTNTSSMAGWQRRMTEKRARIIAEEEREFSRGITSAPSSLAQGRLGEGAKHGLAEARKVREEASRKLQERLMSVAMTA